MTANVVLPHSEFNPVAWMERCAELGTLLENQLGIEKGPNVKLATDAHAVERAIKAGTEVGRKTGREL
jgi:hypothetical protein